MTEKSEQPQPEEGMGAMEEACFQIIASVGTAKSLFIEAIGQAKAGKFDEARASIEEGDKIFVEGHGVHLSLLQQDAAGSMVEWRKLPRRGKACRTGRALDRRLPGEARRSRHRRFRCAGQLHGFRRLRNQVFLRRRHLREDGLAGGRRRKDDRRPGPGLRPRRGLCQR